MLCKKILGPLWSVDCTGHIDTGWACTESSLSPWEPSALCLRWSCHRCPIPLMSPCCRCSWAVGPSASHGLCLEQGVSTVLHPSMGECFPKASRAFSWCAVHCVRHIPCVNCWSKENEKSSSAKVRSTFCHIAQKCRGHSHSTAASHLTPSWDVSENTKLSSLFSLCSLQLVNVKSVFPCSFWAVVVLGLLPS